jgi:hypothetical protein
VIRILLIILILSVSIKAFAETNTVSSTVVTNNTPPTANSPSVVVNNSDVCKTAVAGAVQTQILGISSGITVTDENCERIKLARSLYASGMKVASVSILCQDPREINQIKVKEGVESDGAKLAKFIIAAMVMHSGIVTFFP